MSMKVILE